MLQTYNCQTVDIGNLKLHSHIESATYDYMSGLTYTSSMIVNGLFCAYAYNKSGNVSMFVTLPLYVTALAMPKILSSTGLADFAVKHSAKAGLLNQIAQIAICIALPKETNTLFFVLWKINIMASINLAPFFLFRFNVYAKGGLNCAENISTYIINAETLKQYKEHIDNTKDGIDQGLSLMCNSLKEFMQTNKLTKYYSIPMSKSIAALCSEAVKKNYRQVDTERNLKTAFDNEQIEETTSFSGSFNRSPAILFAYCIKGLVHCGKISKDSIIANPLLTSTISVLSSLQNPSVSSTYALSGGLPSFIFNACLNDFGYKNYSLYFVERVLINMPSNLIPLFKDAYKEGIMGPDCVAV